MRKHYDDYRLGHLTADDSMEGVELTRVGAPNLRNDGRGHRRGSLVDKKMEEGEDAGSIADMDDQKVRDMAMEKFAAQIKKIVSAKLLGKNINVNLKGNKRLVAQVATMIESEVEYLKALMNGQDSNSPALQKNKEILKAQANKLDRMLQTHDFWPFK